MIVLDRYLEKRNVIGYSKRLLPKLIGGEPHPERPAIRFYVTEKRDVPPKDRIPRRIWRWFRQVETDVVELGEVELLAKKKRPAEPGDSIGHYMVTAGTLGEVLYVNGEKMIITNNHVAANSSLDIAAFARKGDPVLQPGTYDGGKFSIIDAQDTIGTLYDYVPFRTDGANIVDVALVKPLLPGMVNGPVSKRFDYEYEVGKKAWYVGRTSGRKEVTIVDTDATVMVRTPHGMLKFADQLVFVPPALPGDSGSVLRSKVTNAFLGLVFAGSKKAGLANKARNVVGVLRRRGYEVTLQAPKSGEGVKWEVSMGVPSSDGFVPFNVVLTGRRAAVKIVVQVYRDLRLVWMWSGVVWVPTKRTVWAYLPEEGEYEIRLGLLNSMNEIIELKKFTGVKR